MWSLVFWDDLGGKFSENFAGQNYDLFWGCEQGEIMTIFTILGAKKGSGGSKIDPGGSKIGPGGSKIDPGGPRVDPGGPGGTKNALFEPALTQLCPHTVPKGPPDGGSGVSFGYSFGVKFR